MRILLTAFLNYFGQIRFLFKLGVESGDKGSKLRMAGDRCYEQSQKSQKDGNCSDN